MAYKYSFSNISSPDRLSSEITSIGITAALDHIEISSGNTDVWFVSELTLEEQLLLDNVFSRHIQNLPNKVVITDGGNNEVDQLDTDNAQIVRIKAAKKGWSFWAVPIEFTTSALDSLYCKSHTGVDIPGITCKIYNGSNQEITEPGLANINLASCVKTVVDFEPTFDYEIIGGALRINSNPSQDVRLWIIGAPDIPAIYGGSKEFASGVNLKFMAPDSSFEIDGRVTKYLIYDPATHQSKVRILLKHPAGLQVNLQVVIHIYRQ